MNAEWCGWGRHTLYFFSFLNVSLCLLIHYWKEYSLLSILRSSSKIAIKNFENNLARECSISQSFPESRSEDKIWAPLGIKCNRFFNPPRTVAWKFIWTTPFPNSQCWRRKRKNCICQLPSPIDEKFPPYVAASGPHSIAFQQQFEGPRVEGQMPVLWIWGKVLSGCSHLSDWSPCRIGAIEVAGAEPVSVDCGHRWGQKSS